MTQRRVLLDVVEALESLDIPYMLVGSFASNYWGRPRTTHDADIVVELGGREARALAGMLEPRFYAPEDVVVEAVRSGDQFNAIDAEEGFKVDFWLRAETAYDRERFARRHRATMFGRPVWVSSAEDTILMKLVWHRQAESSGRQLQDAVQVYEVQAPHLDQAYLDRWAGALGAGDLLTEVRAQAASGD